jgi:predicted DNA-binding protein (MmcQ/YjbR family)
MPVRHIRQNRSMRPLDTLRTLCLGFPEAVEKETWGHPTFRVRDKIFATGGEGEDGVPTMSCKARSEQEALLAIGEPFFHPAYVGSKGWIGVRLGPDTDWDEIAELIEESYRSTAPKRLIAELDGST